MKQNTDNGKYILDNHLRTWSELKRQKAAEAAKSHPQRRNTLSNFLRQVQESPKLPPVKWGGCPEGCDHRHDKFPRRAENAADVHLPPAAETNEAASSVDRTTSGSLTGTSSIVLQPTRIPPSAAAQSDSAEAGQSTSKRVGRQQELRPSNKNELLTDELGTRTPHEMSDEDEYFSRNDKKDPSKAMAVAARKGNPDRKPTVEDLQRWVDESGMGRGKKADGLGDVDEDDEDGSDEAVEGEFDVAAPVESLRGVDLDEAERKDKSLRESVY